MFHRRIRLPDADAIPGWNQEHDGLVHRSYVEGPDSTAAVVAVPDVDLHDLDPGYYSIQVDYGWYTNGKGVGEVWEAPTRADYTTVLDGKARRLDRQHRHGALSRYVDALGPSCGSWCELESIGGDPGGVVRRYVWLLVLVEAV